MKEKVLAHIGSLMGGLVHNLNTPLMWIMGRAQLIQSRNEKYESFKDIPDSDLPGLREKNIKDLRSIQEGADKIDQILKAVGYKIQMVSEGYTSVELREYLEMELNYLMADMRFKHETKREVKIGAKACYVKTDYVALSYAFTGIIDAVIRTTERGRTLNISMEDGSLRIGCPECSLSPEIRQEVEGLCSGLKERADLSLDGSNGFEAVLWMKDT
jgi:two-component system, NtrC family, sensor kinase